MSNLYDVPAHRQLKTTPLPSPQAGAPAHSRGRVTGMRYYPTAQVGRLTGDWNASQVTANEAIRWTLRTTRDRGRDLERGDDFVRGFLAKMETGVIGPQEMRMKPKIIDAKGVRDAAAERIIGTQWKAAGAVGEWTVCGRLSRHAFRKQLLRRLIVDGEALYRIHRGWNNRWAFAVQMLDPDLLDETMNQTAGEGRNKIIMGVEVDGYDRPLRYHLKTSPDSYGNQRVAVDAAEIRHIYVQERPHQARGVTWLASGGLRKKMLDAFEHAVVVGARVAASKMAFITNDKDSPGGYEGDGTAADGSTIMSAEPGEFEELLPGQNVVPFDPQYPPAGFGELERELKRGLATGLNMSYHLMSNDTSQANYSSMKVANIQDRDMFRALQYMLIEVSDDRDRLDWLLMAMTTQAVALPLRKREQFEPANWYPRGWEPVDEAKAMAAAREKLALRLTTRTRLAAEMGEDFDEIKEESEVEEKDLAERGLNHGPPASGVDYSALLVPQDAPAGGNAGTPAA